MAKQVFHFQAGKGMTMAQSNEHLRNWSDRAWAHAAKEGSYDRTREHLNFEVAQGAKIVPVDKNKSIPERMADILNARNIIDPNKKRDKPYYRTIVNIIFSGDHDRMIEMAFGDQQVDLGYGADNSNVKRMPDIEQWAQDMYRFSCERWGEENIVAFVCHLDETGPHIHCSVVPVNEHNRISFHSVFAGKDKIEFKERMRELHTALAQVNAKWGLERGDNWAETRDREVPTREYRKQLVAECNDLERKSQESRGQLADLQREVGIAERRVKGLTTMLNNLIQQQQEIEAEIERLRAEQATEQGDADKIHKRLIDCTVELGKITDRIQGRTEMLERAIQQSDELKAQIEQLEASKAELEEKNNIAIAAANDATSKIQRFIDLRMKEVMLIDVVSDLKEIMPRLSTNELAKLDDTMLMDIIERGSHIIHCAVLLYSGLLDQATDFAQTHGGGGTNSELPWGRKEDEDERAWARHCMRMAHKMMKPATGMRRRR